ncbi:alkaline phosphatase family protein [Brachybacterium paraconglomeratum]|uniref:alkaline phosphatase family protein n=1 Tax=Brachybacterium paraconglomeratum TaxID=173362 RepID=UPI0021A511DA|nr:nucleotide pyrophosphatase/phosphodiesterase family protein [Brachybacterium paraconglomeratum]MCT1909789.1 alkaline phosphatase family protein [Brachybacterium paraconglomeratum]
MDDPALPDWPEDLLAPPFAAGERPGLLDVLAPLASALEEGRDLVVLLDGVGADLLTEHRALTPTLRRLEGSVERIRTVTPSTTASAMVSLHTGLAPLEHGVLGYLGFEPVDRRAVNQLTGAPGLDPHAWMPLTTPVEAGTRRAVQVAPAKHARSHLSGVAYRGWEFLAQGRGDRVEAVRTALHRGGPDALVHLHVDDVDHAGHVHGIDSEPWRTALAEVDALIGTLLRRVPRGTRVHLTADHGMVDTSAAHTVDLAEEPAILSLVEEVTGEARALALHAVPGDGAAAELAERMRVLMGERALVLTREQVLASGLLGPAATAIPEHVRGRIADVLVLARGRWGVDDFSRRSETARSMIGVHGSLTSAEAVVPLLRTIT